MPDHAAPTSSTIQPLSQHPEYEIEDDALDVRGWEVTTPAFAPVGVVQDLLVDTVSCKVRYLDVALSAETGHAGKRLLLPIGKALLDGALDRVVVMVPSCLDALASEGAELTELSRDDERRILEGYGEPANEDGEFYACPAFHDGGFARRRADAARGGRRVEDAKVGVVDAAGQQIDVEVGAPG